MPSLQEYIALGEFERGLAQPNIDDEEEIIRLPLFLRLLAETDLDCLEDRAAKFTSAEEIQILACYLAPKVCRKWKRNRNKRKQLQQNIRQKHQDDDEDDDEDTFMADAVSTSTDDEEDHRDREPATDSQMQEPARIEVDSQEAVLLDTLEELVVKSESDTAVLSDDSILFQPTGGAVLASLMHYAPQLLHSKVAQLIVRSGRSEKRLLRYLAANCPSAQCTIEAILPDIMEEEDVEDLDVTALEYIAYPIDKTQRTRTAMERLAKFPENKLYCQAMVWTMMQLQCWPSDVEKLKGIPLLVAAVLSVEDSICESLCRILVNESNERLLLALHHEDHLLNIICDFLEVKAIHNEQFLKSAHQFVGRTGNMSEKQVWHDPAVTLQRWKAGGVESNTVETILHEYLHSQEKSELLVSLPIAADFISRAVEAIENPVPLVHAVALERMCLQMRIDSPLFLVSLYYCFAFQEKNPTSPFCFNPRNLPLRQILQVSETVPWSDDLVKCLNASCPEVQHLYRYFNTCQVVGASEQIRMKQSLSVVVKQCLRDLDDEGARAETAFIEASAILSDADLISTTVSALMTKRGSPTPFFTYSMLYKDPLCILKCPLQLWNRASFRRLVLTILMLLVDVNTAVVLKEARSPELAMEYIVSRDLVVLQSLLAVATNETTSKECEGCDMLLALVRKLVAQHKGIVSTILRQEVPESSLDWLVQWVPETICDGIQLQRVLYEKNYWNGASARLKAADFSVRVAVAHGHRSVKVSASMIANSLSVLLSSFFTVLGPVGISVDAARGGEGNDATHSNRVVAFRLLRAIQKLRVYRRSLKVEIIPILQKLMGMCKGEVIVGSLPFSVTGKQKSFLKDLSDAVSKTLDMLGPGK